MIVQAITFFLQMLTTVFFEIESHWVITSDNGVTITIGSVILWYLCLAVGMIIIMRLIGGSSSGGKKDA